MKDSTIGLIVKVVFVESYETSHTGIEAVVPKVVVPAVDFGSDSG